MLKIIKYAFLINTVVFSFLLVLPLQVFATFHDSSELINKSIISLSSLNKVKLYTDSAAKYNELDFSKTIHFADLAISNFDNDTPDSLKLHVFRYLFSANYMIGNYAKALEYTYEELKLLEKNSKPNNKEIAGCFVNIGETYRAAADYDNSLKFLSKAVEIYSELNNDEGFIGLTAAYDRMAAVYFELAIKKNDDILLGKSNEFSLKSLDLAEKYNLINRKISTWNILGACEVYKKNYKKALDYFEIALKESINNTDYNNKINIQINIGSCYFELKNYNKAIEFCELAFIDAKEHQITVYVKMAAKILYESYSFLNQYEKAYNYLLDYTNANDILSNEERDRTISMIEQNKINELKNNEIKKQRERFILLSIGGIWLVILIIVGFVIRNRVLKKINKKLINNSKIISEQKSALEEINASQNMFFSILSHDLRNPFNGILGFLSILKNDFDKLSNEEKKQYIEYVSTSADQVFKLLERLLELARLKDGRYQFRFERINIKEISEQVVQLQRTNTLNKKVTVVNNIDSDVFINADKLSVDTILRNLTDNAIKFTPAGGKIVFSSEIDNQNVNIYVRDNGVGMDFKDVENIFRLDKKIVSKGTNDEKGTGLGLYVCKEMIEKMNGSIKVESEIGKGSTFIVTFPLAK